MVGKWVWGRGEMMVGEKEVKVGEREGIEMGKGKMEEMGKGFRDWVKEERDELKEGLEKV